jgi:hypothetical protein
MRGSPRLFPVARAARPLAAALTAALLAAACSSDDGPGPAGPDPVLPAVVSAEAAANPHNVISAIVRAESRDAETVRVEFGRAGSFDESTPDFPATGGVQQLPVLGLHEESDYQLRVVATSATGDTAVGAPLAFRTGSLPASVVDFEVVRTGASSPGFTLLAPSTVPYHPPVVVDLDGRVVWYRETSAIVADFQLQPNGHYTGAVIVPNINPFLGAEYEEWDVLGNLVDVWTAPGWITDLHELRLIEDGNQALILGFSTTTADLTPFGGPAEGTVVGNVLQRLVRGGAVLFEWNSVDHYALEDALPFAWVTAHPGGFDMVHANAIELDTDGNYLISSRHLSEVTKIDSETGGIIWRMGKGPANEFTFLNDPHDGFHMQHTPRRLENGNLLLIDNGNFHAPPSSRAVEYAVDEQARTATLVWSFEPGIFSCCMGNAQRLPDGNTLVALGNDFRVFEVTQAGQVVWELRFPTPANIFGFYRAFRVPSLYGNVD